MKWNMAWHAGSLETNQGLGTNYSEKNSSPLNINLAKLLRVWLPLMLTQRENKEMGYNYGASGMTAGIAMYA